MDLDREQKCNNMDDWEQKYNDLEYKYNRLVLNHIRISSITGMMHEIQDKLVQELTTAKQFIAEDIPYAKPFWGTNLRELNKISIELLNIWNDDQNDKINGSNDESIYITRFRPSCHRENVIPDQTIKRHVINVNEIVKFKCRNDEFCRRELTTRLMKLWLQDKQKDNYIIGSWNTENLQRILQASDHHFRQFTSAFHQLIGYKVFASQRQTTAIRIWNRSKSANVFSIVVERGRKKGKISLSDVAKRWQRAPDDEITKCHVFFMNDLEAICMCIDADINRNHFTIPQIIIEFNPRTIIDSLAGDKQSVYGFSEGRASMTTMNQPMSAARTVPTVLVCGNFADSYHTHASIINTMKKKFNYDKAYMVKALSDFPVVITLVLYNIDQTNDCIQSRFSSSAVAIWQKKMKQECLAGIEDYDESCHTVCDESIVDIQNEFTSNTQFAQTKQRKQSSSNEKKYSKKQVSNLWQDHLSSVIIYLIIYFILN